MTNVNFGELADTGAGRRFYAAGTKTDGERVRVVSKISECDALRLLGGRQ